MPSVSLWAFLAENYFLLQISQPCGAGLFAFSQKKLLLVQRAVAWDRLHSFYKNHRRRGRSAGPEAGRGVSSPPSLPLDSTHPATRKGLLAPSNPKAVGLHTKNPSRFAKGFFVLRRFQDPSAALRATAPPSGSKRTRKLCGLPGNFAVMPRALPLGELASPTGLD